MTGLARTRAAREGAGWAGWAGWAGRAGRAGAAAASLWVLLACELFSPGARVVVQMPEPPPQWLCAFPRLSFVVRYVDARGQQREVPVADWRASVEVVCSKEQNAPFLAYPVAALGGEPGSPIVLPPAGGFFPLSLGSGESARMLSLSWEEGCAALLVSRVRSLGRDMSMFNLARLLREMRESEDPWGWDADRIAERIAAGCFSAFDISRLAVRDVTISPGEGEWFLESPFAPVRRAANGQRIELAAVPCGAHTLFSTAGERVRVFVGEEETVIGPVER